MLMTRRECFSIAAAIVGVTPMLAGRATPSGAPSGSSQKPTREIEITAKRSGFDPARIEVTQGDLVKLTIKSGDSTHGFEIKKLKINKEIPKGGRPVVIQFVAGEPGEFEISCSEYCGKGHNEMKGLLVVKPR